MKRSVLAVSEQGLFALGSFALHIFLARWLSPAEYGAFAIIYAVYALLALAHSASVIEPMLAYAPGRYRKREAEYVGCLLKGHGAVMVAVALTFLLSAWWFRVAHNDVLASCTLGAAVGIPGLLTVGLARRAHYIRLEPGYPVLAGMLYLTLLVAGLAALSYQGWLGLTTAWLVITACSLLAAGVLVRALHLPTALRTRRPGVFKLVIRDHFEFGKWAVPGAVAAYFVGGLYYYALPVTQGLEAVGMFRAAINLATPAFHAVAAVAFLASASLAASLGEGADPRPLMRRVALQALAGLLVYSAVIVWLGDRIVAAFYGASSYEFSQALFVILALLPIGYLGPALCCAGLRALERPRRIFHAAVIALVVAGSIGVILTWQYGLIGALLGTLLGYGTFGAASFLFWRQERGRVHSSLRNMRTLRPDLSFADADNTL